MQLTTLVTVCACSDWCNGNLICDQLNEHDKEPEGSDPDFQNDGDSEGDSDGEGDDDGGESGDEGDGHGVGGISAKKLKCLMVNAVQIALHLQCKPGRRLPPRVIDKRKGRGRLEDEKALDKGWQKNIYLVSQIHQLVVTDC